MPPTTPPGERFFGLPLESNAVPAKRILITGIILGVFHPPVVGLVYALCFAFTKATRRIALYVATWTILWTLLYGFSLGFLAAWLAHANLIR